MSRRAARAKALQALFAVDLGRMAPERAVEEVLADEQLSLQAAAFARQLVMGTVTARQELDAIISRYAVGWRLERLAAVDRNILRMALYEMKYCPDTPVSVIINEAIELAKTFNDEEAGRFVNGLLDTARKELGR
ncbi:Transcription antitermination protein NusB [Neomoorella glycerini]|uniref:Transcription antitermination protein NusB n=1 Tax=Neomoorella glycerini TaxID=55779 RepID=A0A6I5ZWQ9_9FIRM|nr:transcription antitermination factor NusB [Moorella glycerini]QGP94075.1 Transcription antitermination protein NusB [Moorella glycerini]